MKLLHQDLRQTLYVTLRDVCFIADLKHPSFVTTNNGNLDLEKMKSKSDVCIFGLSIGLTLDKRNSLNNLKATSYVVLTKKKEHYYKNKLEKNMLQLLDVKPMPKFKAFYICDNGAIIAASSTACRLLINF